MRRKQLPHSQRSLETMRVRSRKLKRIIGCWRRCRMVQIMLPISPCGTGLLSSTPTTSKKVEVLMEMQAGFGLTLEGAHAHLVGAVHVVDVAAPQLFELLAEGVLGVGAEPAAEQLGLEIAHVEFQFVACDLGELSGVFRPHVPDIGAPFLRDLDLPAR